MDSAVATQDSSVENWSAQASSILKDVQERLEELVGQAQEVLDTDEGKVAAAATALVLVGTLVACWPRRSGSIEHQLQEIDLVCARIVYFIACLCFATF